LPLNDRDYMRQPPSQPRRRVWVGGGSGSFFQNPVYLLIILNLIVYIASFVNSEKLLLTFGLMPAEITSQPWTIITAMFVHIDFWHIFGNMLTLFFFGRVVYQLVGTWWFLAVYFVGGIAGNAMFLWLGGPYSIAIGASGAIYALAGALVVMMPTMKVALWGIIQMPLWVFVIFFLGIWSIPYINPYIGWQAHLGGFVIGLLAGLFFRTSRRFYFIR
jgi:membrane associated rhomboid family serine protease